MIPLLGSCFATESSDDDLYKFSLSLYETMEEQNLIETEKIKHLLLNFP